MKNVISSLLKLRYNTCIWAIGAARASKKRHIINEKNNRRNSSIEKNPRYQLLVFTCTFALFGKPSYIDAVCTDYSILKLIESQLTQYWVPSAFWMTQMDVTQWIVQYLYKHARSLLESSVCVTRGLRLANETRDGVC